MSIPTNTLQMKKTVLLLFLAIPFLGISQTDYLSLYQEAKQLAEKNQVDASYLKFKALEERIPKSDT